MIDIRKREVGIHCPNCKRIARVSLKQVVDEETIKCMGCSKNIKLVDKNKSAHKAVRDINKSISDLQKAFKP
ncbi:MAG: hypothetical protein KDC93_18540 [Cyclobacteriaceae bacterium]|nr:hypothetical protein [Cyclobacteriaceae bacterium]